MKYTTKFQEKYMTEFAEYMNTEYKSEHTAEEVINKIKEKFEEIYGGSDIVGTEKIEEHGYVSIPGYVTGHDGKTYPAILEYNTHISTQEPITITMIVTEIGLITPESYTNYLEPWGDSFAPYKYTTDFKII